MFRFVVYKENETLDVLLLKYKDSDTYSFINLTKGHICSCVFNTVEDAIKDIEQRKKDGLLLDYKII